MHDDDAPLKPAWGLKKDVSSSQLKLNLLHLSVLNRIAYKSIKNGCNEVHEYENSKIWTEKLRCSSKIKPTFPAELVVLSGYKFCILASCCLSPREDIQF